MQTFLPYADYTRTAKCLDRQRLGKQRVECKQILNALENGGGWSNHPATKMWVGHEYELTIYAVAIVNEWINRGYKDSMMPFFLDKLQKFANYNRECPYWMGGRIHTTHRSNLLRKLPDHYEQFNWGGGSELEYHWPV